ncbi:MAG: site-specific integrase [Verrucomicrobia bacterium]|nr:site-specific integrase [Verrucomicrobiota bacterium]
MASIHRQPGKPNWFCAFYDPEGFRRFRSTGTDNSRIARTICVNIERAATLARQGRLSNEKGLKLIRETCAAVQETHGKLAADQAQPILQATVEEFVRVAGGELTTYTVKTWFESWLAGRTDASKATLIEYRRIVDLFLNHLGARATKPLTTLDTKQVQDFKQALTNRVAPSTVNKALKVLKASLSNAVAKRQLEFSPADHVEAVQTEETGRRPFTEKEIQALLTTADAEWKTMIVLAYYTGLRLRDCANLTWQNVDILANTIAVKTQKTGRQQVLPIAEPLAKHLSAMAGDNPDAPLCPALKDKTAGWLSAQFYRLMVKAGLAEERNHQSKGKGRDARREASKISFHSFRHSTTSALKSAGVSDAVTMDIIGHETEAVSRNYTVIDDASKRAALAKLPDILKGEA